jgi:hypothetical protein
MRAWCPRCDAVRPGATACPVCATPLATLEDAAASADRPPEPPPPGAAPDPPPRSRLRIALAAATVVVAGLAFVAGRSIARPAASAAGPAPATTTTAPEPGANRRELGWTARAGGVTVTAVEASRLATERRDTVTSISFRIQGVPADQLVLGLRGLRLLDSGGGVYAGVEERRFGNEAGAPIEPVEGTPGAYRLVTGSAPRLSSLARIELTGVVSVRPRDRSIALDTSGSWPAGPRMRVIDPGPAAAVQADLGVNQVAGVDLELRVGSAFVRDGRAVVVVDVFSGFRGVPGELLLLPIGAELRVGGRVLCARTSLLGEDAGQQFVQGIVLSCPARQVPRLTVALGVGARIIPFDANLRP